MCIRDRFPNLFEPLNLALSTKKISPSDPMLKSLVSTKEVVSNSLFVETKNIIITNEKDIKIEQILESFMMFEWLILTPSNIFYFIYDLVQYTYLWDSKLFTSQPSKSRKDNFGKKLNISLANLSLPSLIKIPSKIFLSL